jgi:nucleoside-diphosphate-sugar epimerase
MKNILVTGGAGYKGCILIPKLLKAGYKVTAYDLMLFGAEGLPKHKNLTVLKADIRDISEFSKACVGINTVIHMACISNDPSFELDESLSRTINYDCFEPLVIAAKTTGVRRFIYVSSSSVYGVSDAPEVTEEHPLIPLTLYNKYKGLCEPLLFKHQSSDFECVTLRPATVCGYSPRMRFDLTINILTNHAVNKGLITVFGGSQKRPNIHIDDVTELYVNMIEYPAAKVAGEIFNVGYENFTVSELATFVKSTVEKEFPSKIPINITTTPSNDNRSYHVSSKKIWERLGWKPKRTIENAVQDLCLAFKDGRFGQDTMTNEAYVNVKVVKGLALK